MALIVDPELARGVLETLARFRPDPHVLAGLARIEGDDGTGPAGLLPRSWLQGRVIGEAAVRGRFCQIGAPGSLAHLHRALAPALVRHGIRELDGAAIRLTAPRRFTVGTNPVSVAIGDLNGDLIPDLVTADPVFSAVTVLLGLGDGTFEKLQLGPPQ